MSAGGGGSGRVYRVEAVVLRRVSTGETDRVLTLFARDRGKLGAIAKGARGPRSRLSGATEPFTCFDGLLAVGQSLDVLTQAEVRYPFNGIRSDLLRVGYASYLLEMVDAGVEERQPSTALWDLLVGALACLDDAATPDVLARAFELHAMSVLGYEPRLDECAVDGAPLAAGAAGFHPLRGGLLCQRCRRSLPGSVPVGPETRSALEGLAAGPLRRAAHAGHPERVRREMARCLVPFVRYHLNAPLRSLQYLDNVSP